MESAAEAQAAIIDNYATLYVSAANLNSSDPPAVLKTLMSQIRHQQLRVCLLQ